MISTIEKNAPTNEEVNAAVSAWPPCALPRHRVAVESRGHRPRLAGDVEEDRGDGAAEERAPVDRSEQDDRRGGRHGEGERQQDGHAVGAAQSRQHADDGAQQDADHGHEQIEGRERDVKAEEEVLEAHRSVAQPGLERSLGHRAPGTISRRP